MLDFPSVFNKSSVGRCGCVGRCRFDVIVSVLVWSCKALLAGNIMKLTMQGEPVSYRFTEGEAAVASARVHGTGSVSVRERGISE